MGTTRPLREVFDEVSTGGGTDPQGVLAAAGHPDLPPDLLGEAVVNYADTAPPEVAEHLAPLVMAHTGVVPEAGHVPGAQDAEWLDALAGAPHGMDVPVGADPASGDPAVDLDGVWQVASAVPGPAEPAAPAHDLADLHFGYGSQATVERPLGGADADSAAVGAVDDLDGLASWPAPEEPAGRVDPFFDDVRDDAEQDHVVRDDASGHDVGGRDVGGHDADVGG